MVRDRLSRARASLRAGAAALAAELGVVIPISFFEKDGPHYYNSVAMADADGEILGVYRKSHIPDGPGYQEKYYFRPGDTGFKAWKTRYGGIGVGICWDQWFPEAARAWRSRAPRSCSIRPPSARSRTTQRSTPTAMAARDAGPCGLQCRAGRGREPHRRRGERRRAQTFYGHSFIADHRGELVASFGAAEEGRADRELRPAEIERYRADWGFFRDRRPDLYAKSLI